MEGFPIVGWRFSVRDRRSSAFICGFIASAACGPVAHGRNLALRYHRSPGESNRMSLFPRVVPGFH